VFDFSFGGASNGACYLLIICVFVWGWNNESMNIEEKENFHLKPIEQIFLNFNSLGLNFVAS
jgi:hypothetical protein